MAWKDCDEQPRAASILFNSLRNNRVAHAYLFIGRQGVGKKKLSFQLAKSLLCVEQNGDSCEVCHQCQRIESKNHPDVHFVAPDGATIKIDQIRELRKEFSYRAVESNRKIYILEHAEKMTVQAANSLLKFLEEPSSEVTAVLLSENAHQLLPTIVSRCQSIMFQDLSQERKMDILKAEGFHEPLIRSACQITGDLAKARELCQSEWFAQFRNVVLQLSKDILDRGSYALVNLQDKVLKNDMGNQGLPIILDLLLYWYRDLLFCLLNQRRELSNTDALDEVERQALRYDRNSIHKAMGLILETKHRLERHVNPQMAMERMIIELQEVIN